MQTASVSLNAVRRYPATMALIVPKQVARFYGDPPDGAVALYLGIDDEYLKAYDLADDDRIEGSIVEVADSRHSKPVEGLADERVSFVPDPGMGRLFVSEESFETLREWGFVEDGYWLAVELDEATIDGEEVAIYRNRDVEV